MLDIYVTALKFIMSSLLNQKYQKVTHLEESSTGQERDVSECKTQTVPSDASAVSSGSLIPLSTMASLPPLSASTRRRHFLMHPSYSIDESGDVQLSLPSSFEQTMDANQVSELSQGINESRSESWFTASSHMDDPLLSLQTNAPPGGDEFSQQPVKEMHSCSFEPTDSSANTEYSTTVSLRWNPDQKAGTIKVGRSLLEEGDRTGTFSLINVPSDSVCFTCCARSTTPAEYLRLKWKKLFYHQRLCRSGVRSPYLPNHASPSPVSIELSNRNPNVAFQCMTCHSSSNPSIQRRTSSYSPFSEKDESVHKPNTQVKDRVQSGLVYSSKRTYPQSLRSSSQGHIRLHEAGNMDEVVQMVIEKDRIREKVRRSKNKEAYTSIIDDDRTPGEPVFSSISANLKTSSEQDEDDELTPAYNPDAHIGALALAWTSSSARNRRALHRDSSDCAKSPNSSQEAEACDKTTLKTQYEGNADWRRILQHKDLQEPLQFKQESVECSDDCSKKSRQIRKPSTASRTSPHGIKGYHPERDFGDKKDKNTENTELLDGFLKRFKRCCCPCCGQRSSRKISILSSSEEQENELDALETSQDTGEGQYNRTHVRRGGQNIAPMCMSGGLLGRNQTQGAQLHTIGWRLSQRKILNEKRRRLANYSFLFAVLGVLLMVVDQECRMAKYFTASSTYSLVLKSANTALTMILVCLVICYHAADVKLFSVNNCIDDWRLATSSRKIYSATMEVLLCLIHPVPVISNSVIFNRIFADAHPSTAYPLQQMKDYGRVNSTDLGGLKSDHNATTEQINWLTGSSELSSFEVCLSVPMFFRFYLIFRLLLLHSTFYTDAGSRSIGAMNRVKINVRFVLKTLATTKPGTMLLIFIISMWVITSWIMRVCEREQNKEYGKMVNTMWLISVTFLSIGYGDMVPHTNCGRSVSVFAGVMGSACTALVVAVVAKKLELTRAEKHVHNFMRDNKVYKQLRHSAANVLRETWLFYKHTRLVKRVNASRVRRHQRSFLQSIRALRKAKADQRKLRDDASSMVEVWKMQASLNDILDTLRSDQGILIQRLATVETGLTQIQTQISQLPETLSSVFTSCPFDEVEDQILMHENGRQP